MSGNPARSFGFDLEALAANRTELMVA